MRREYCVKAVLNDDYILYIGYVFGGYQVFRTDKEHTFNYSLYGSYKNIGTAENRLFRVASSYPANAKSLHYMSKELLHKLGAFSEEQV